MNVLILIDGREAIPVRAIPLLTTWDQLGAGMIAAALAGDEHVYPHFVGLIAHRVEDQQVKQIPENYWRNKVAVELQALYEKVTRDHDGLGPAAISTWRKSYGAVALLPPGAFVWRDEFEERFWRWCGPKGERMWVAGPGGGVAVPARRGESIKLDFDPFVPDVDLKRLVMEGFEINEPAKEMASVSEFAASSKPGRSPTRQRAQEAAILEMLAEQGHSPKQIPQNIPGRSGVKSQIRQALVGLHPDFPVKTTVFDKAWDRLLASEDISYSS